MQSTAYTFLLIVLCGIPFCTNAQTDVLRLKSDVIDTIFGRPVADPYRWMETPGSDSVKEWLKEQKKITKTEQKRFNGRMVNVSSDIEINSSFRYASAEKTGPWYFQMMTSRSPSSPAHILYYRENKDDQFEIAFDPNEISGRTKYNRPLRKII